MSSLMDCYHEWSGFDKDGKYIRNNPKCFRCEMSREDFEEELKLDEESDWDDDADISRENMKG